MARKIRPLQGRHDFVKSDPAALPTAIQFVRYADHFTWTDDEVFPCLTTQV